MRENAVAERIREVLAARQADSQLEDSFFVADLEALKQQVALWNVRLPFVKAHYAVKCNNHPKVVETLLGCGVNFDCASQTEIELVTGLGAQPSQIVYANPIKAPSQLKFASAQGVKHMTFDNHAELHKIKQYAPQSELLLRIKTDDSGAICSLSCKFGAALSQTEGLLRDALSLGLKVVGVAYHVGSGGGIGPEAHAKALHDAKLVFDSAAQLCIDFKVLDIGGGFEPSESSFLPVTEEIERSARKYGFLELQRSGKLEIIGEPGRFMVAPVFTLVANVIGIRRSPSPDEVDMVYLTDGVYGNLNSIIYDHQQPKARLVGDSTAAGTSKASLWGPTCDGLDCIDAQAVFPRQLAIGDWLYFGDTGAYTLVGESTFNGFNTHTQIFVA